MFEKVNPSHPDKVADRIAGAMVDLAYAKQNMPKVAVEVLIGHGHCHIIGESSYPFTKEEASAIVDRIDGKRNETDLLIVPQDIHLADNQAVEIRCGDNGIFKGAPITKEQRELTSIASILYLRHPYDGKYLLAHSELTVCQSHMKSGKIAWLEGIPHRFKNVIVNPLGSWTGGTDVDTGATNRKLGSDMGDGITGGGLHGKDLSKADVAVNIYAFLEATIIGRNVELNCSIGDEYVVGIPIEDIAISKKKENIPYSRIVETASRYIRGLGGFEKLAEWGLIR